MGKHTASAGDNGELRRLAEKRSHDHKGPARDVAVSDVDAKRLVHELQVYQIELEMQNAELLNSYRKLEEETAARIQIMEELREKTRCSYSRAAWRQWGK